MLQMQTVVSFNFGIDPEQQVTIPFIISLKRPHKQKKLDHRGIVTSCQLFWNRRPEPQVSEITSFYQVPNKSNGESQTGRKFDVIRSNTNDRNLLEFFH